MAQKDLNGAGHAGVEPPAEHVPETVRSIAELRADHRRRSTPLQQIADRFIRFFGQPGTLVVLTVCVAAWIGGNLVALHQGWQVLDAPPFFWLEGFVSLFSLYLVILVLASQRREDELEQRRDLLSLELAILGEQKTAKIISCSRSFVVTTPICRTELTGKPNGCRYRPTPTQY